MAIKCETCIHNIVIRTGEDEYPQCASIPMCAKNHWIDEGEQYEGETEDFDPWEDCIDYD